jgi:serine/threonine protein kinase
LYFAIEYIPGNNLGRRISNKKDKLPRSTIQKWTAEIIVALEYLHSMCIVYRDLKASNILVSKRNHIKLIDFGLSVYDCDNKLRGFAGTLEYAAPEMAGHKQYGRAVDYYSLGILLFRLVTGKLPLSRNQVNMDKQEFLAYVASGFKFPSSGDKIADDLIAHFCDRNVANRYGVRLDSHQLIRNHPFFHGFQWSSVKTITPEESVDNTLSVRSSSKPMVTLDRLYEVLSSEEDSYE